MRRVLAAVASVALLVAGVVTPSTPALADPVSECSTSAGVLVVVDLRPFGGSVTRGCDASPTTGYDALQEAGYRTTGTQHDGPAFVCRIDGQPSSDPCVRTPPTSAYWSYWHADAGRQSWSYSTQGASSYRPKPGSIDAWVFGGTDVGGTSGQPCFSPADARAGRATSCAVPPRPKPTRATKTPKPNRARSTARPSAPATSPDRTVSPSASVAGRSSTSAASTTPSSSPATSLPTARATTAVPSSSAAPTIVDASQAAGDRKESGGGSPLPLVLGLGLALVLAAGAGVATMRRRRADPGS